MIPIRRKMIEAMQLHGLSEATQKSYVRHVRQLTAHYHKSPDQLSEEEVRRYLLYLQNEKKMAHATCIVAVAALRFFYQRTLQQTWGLFDLVRPRREKKLPVVLSVEEVQRILSCVRRQRHRICLTTIYSCGLRISEGTRLQVSQIDGEYNRLHICQSKGNKDRYVPLPQRTLLLYVNVWLPITIPNGSFQDNQERRGLWRLLGGLWLLRRSTAPSMRLLLPVAYRNRGRSIHYAILWPLICWRQGFTYGSSKPGWTTNTCLLQPCMPI
jgi:integrase